MTSALETTAIHGGLLRENQSLARSVNPERVREIAGSIKEIGLLNPIIVRPKEGSVSGQVGQCYEILAGVHRFRAMFRILGWEHIPARIVSVDDLRARLITLDENLAREELGEVDRAEYLKERKEIYEALHPETKSTKEGAFHGNRHTSSLRHGGDDQNSVVRFTKDAADKTGRGERSIQRDIEVAEKISTSALALIKGTILDTQRYLHKLKHVPKEDQVRTVKRDLANPDGVQHARKARKPAASSDPPRNDTVDAEHLALVRAWESARPESRNRFLRYIGAPFEVAPGMDRKRA